jgi:uncharacterized protein YraI
VIADLLWVRERPGTEYAKVTRLVEGTRVEFDGVANGPWIRISAPAEGWVASEFLQLLEAAPDAAAATTGSDTHS